MKTVVILTLFVVLWFAFLRPWLRDKPWMKWFFHSPPVEWFEIYVYRKAESIGLARYFTALGGILTAVSSYDPSTIQLFAPLLPEEWQGYVTMLPMVLTVFGLVGEWMRRDISKPLEMVEIASTAPVEVKVIAAQADIVTKVAVADIKSETAKAA